MDTRGYPFPEDILAAWQRSVDLIVRLTGARVGLIMRIIGEEIEVFVSSTTEGNPYAVGDRERLIGSGLYCEAVIASQEMLAVADALSSERWKNNPDIKHNMVSYLGFPIRWGDGQPFGTICLLDDKANEHHRDAVELMAQMRDLIESHLKLKETAEDLERLVQERTRKLQAEVVERAAAQEALQRSEARLKAAERLARLGNWERNLSTDQYFFSDEMYRIFGLDRQDPDATSDRFWSILHCDDRDSAYAIFREVVATGAPHEATHRIILPSGEQRVVQAITHLIRDEEGRPASVQGIVQDITEQERAKEALQRSQAMLAEAERIAHVGSWRTDLATGEMVLSDELRRICGFGPEMHTITLRDLDRIIHPDDLPGVHAVRQRAWPSAREISTQYRIVPPDGEIRMLQVSGDIRRNAAGEPTHVYGVAQDITERARADAAVAERVRQLTTLHELSHPVSFRLPLDEIVHAYLERLIGFSSFDMAGLYLLQGETLRCLDVCSRLPLPVAPEPLLAVGEGLIGLAVQRGELEYAPEIVNDPRCNQPYCRVQGVR